MSEPSADLEHFDLDAAWSLGAGLVASCTAAGYAVTILIMLGEQRVFHVAMPGTSADNDGWAERKARVVMHFGRSSHEVHQRYARDNPRFSEAFALPASDYAPYGGSVPIIVRGIVVGALAVSGLSSDEDHQIAAKALYDLARQQQVAVGTASPSAAENGWPLFRLLKPGQRSQVWLGGPDLAEPQLLLDTSDLLIEAPNWSLDGTALFLNGNGSLWRIDLARPPAHLVPVTFSGLPPINNDHVLSPDGRSIYLSAMDGHIYRGPLTGGVVERVTADEDVWHFLHGVSPDGKRLAYVRLGNFTEPGRLAVMEPFGSSQIIDTGSGHTDGPEWSPDGRWIYFNTETFTTSPGHAQLARIRSSGGDPERILATDTVDWFPHLSPDGLHASYIAFPAGTEGHPADLAVEVRVVRTDDWSVPVQTYPLMGGQGTINVNSWSPDSTRFAFVSYPTD